MSEPTTDLFASRARELEDRLFSVAVLHPEIRGLLLIDGDGLPLVSNLRSRGLEERLSAFASRALAAFATTPQDFEMGALRMVHLTGRERQLFLAPVTRSVHLLAIVDIRANVADVTLALTALGHDVLALALDCEPPAEQR